MQRHWNCKGESALDMKNIFAKILDLIKKYRYAVLVFIIGLILMALPDFNMNRETELADIVEKTTSEPTLEEKLSQILSQVDGAGNVQVVLTVETGEEVVYQTDDDETTTADSTARNTDTVIITDANRNQSGLIRQVNSAIYQGAIVVCEGAEDPTVHLAIVDAVSKITGLGTNRISVLKMK